MRFFINLCIVASSLMGPTLLSAITCDTDCGAYAREEWTCGYSLKKRRPNKCSVTNPLKKANCEAQKTADCYKNKIADWVEDRFAEDNGRGSMVSHDGSYMAEWSPGLTSAKDCVGEKGYGTVSLSMFYSTDAEQAGANASVEGDNSLLCYFDKIKNVIKSKGLWVCEDPDLFKAIHDGRQGAYYSRASHHKVCQLRWRHLPNGWSNAFQRSRTIMECAETHGARQWTNNGKPLTFICEDMSGEIAAIGREQEDLINQNAYEAEYLDAFANAKNAFDITSYPEFDAQVHLAKEAQINLQKTEDELATLNGVNTQLESQNDALRAELRAFESDQALLYGAIEKKKELQKSFQDSFEKKTEEFRSKWRTYLKELETYKKYESNAKAFAEEVLGYDGEIEKKDLTALLKKKSLALATQAYMCDDRALENSIHEAQSGFVEVEETIENYELLLGMIRIPDRFPEHKEILNPNTDSLRDDLYRFGKILSPETFALKGVKSYCHGMKEALFALESMSVLQTIKDENGELDSELAREKDVYRTLMEKKTSMEIAQGFQKNLRNFQRHFDEAIDQKRLKKAYELYQSWGAFSAAMRRDIASHMKVSLEDQAMLVKSVDAADQKIKASGDRYFEKDLLANILWQRLDAVSYILMLNADKMETLPDVAAIYAKIVKIHAYDPETFEFKLPQIRGIEDALRIEEKVAYIESLVKVLQ